VQIVCAHQDHQSRKKPVQIVETYGNKKQPLNAFSLLRDARRPDKRSINGVSGKMKNPPMTTLRIDALGVTQVPGQRTLAKSRN
jgi:hypothetical protein